MACNAFLNHSKSLVFQNSHHSSCMRSIFKIISTEPYVNKSHQQIARSHYSTVYIRGKSFHRKNIFLRLSKCSSPVSFMSTSSDGNQYQIVITNPAQSNSSIVDVPADSAAGIGDIVRASTLTEGGSNAALEAADFAGADVVASLSTGLSSVVELAAEPSLASLGLCNWTPVGLVQMGLEYLHISCHMPWWAAIGLATIMARILLLPVLIKTQRNAINMGNYMPQLQFLQAKFGEARKTGNSMEASRYANEIVMYMKEHNINPLKNALMPMIQAPVFISFFMGLRSMAKTPVESMEYGGIWWVQDLTLPDPYYITPVIACGTLYVVLKLGAESGVRMENLKMAKYVLQALPLVALPFCINMPAAVMYYWVTTNFCTLLIVAGLKIQPVRKFFKLPTYRPADPQYAKPKKGFVSSVKEAIEDQKVLSAIAERRKMDEVRFMKAGTGPVPRTYSYDPTKPRPSNVAVSAKQSDKS